MPGKVKRLNDSQRLVVISKLSQSNSPNKRNIARHSEVSETAIRKVSINRGAIRQFSALIFEDPKTIKPQASVNRFTELEDKLHFWIDSMLRANQLHWPF